MILADIDVGGQPRKVLTHFDRNGFAYTLDRATGELLVAKKYDPAVNWATEVVMDKNSEQYGRPVHLNLVVDPSVLGGVSVEIGDDVIDGTVSSRLDDARRRLAG